MEQGSQFPAKVHRVVNPLFIPPVGLVECAALRCDARIPAPTQNP